LALIFAWAFELTPDGLKLEKEVVREESITHATGRKLDFVIIGMLVVALGFFTYDKFVLDPDRDAVKIEAAVQFAREEITSAVAPQDSAKTIAVLPFVNMSDDPGNEYFSDGISEEILNLLAKIPELRVTSRSSAFSFKGQNLDVPTMAARLNVAHVLEGSVRKSGNQLRITAQLIEVVTDTHLWSQTYDRELKNVFAIQDEIAAAVVDALKITLLGEEPKATETDPEAYALYLQARHLMNQYTAEVFKQAETLLTQALAIDPEFAAAWAELGNLYNTEANLGFHPVDEGNELAREAIQRALNIDPQYGRAYAVLAEIEMYYNFDLATAFLHLKHALELGPGDAFILRQAANMNVDIGHIDEAINLHRQSIALDPVSAYGHHRLGIAFLIAHRLEEAANSLQMALSLSPGRVQSQYMLGRVLLAQGDAPAALVAMEQETSDFYRLTGTAIVQYALGDAGASDAALNELIETWSAAGAYQIAQVYGIRGEIDDAFDWLETAYNNRDAGLPAMMRDPSLVDLHDDPRWEPFLDKLSYPL
jgi:TolB-like protein/cytochrome c-type biogenesis protein CcmH/NrfG